MSYCINPLCPQRQNSDLAEFCITCKNPLLINQRIRLKKPLRPFHLPSHTEIFEVEDLGTKWNPGKKTRIMKVLKWAEPKLVELIEREFRALSLIESTNIPKSTADDFFVFSPENTPLKLYCLVMDKIPGQDLETWIERNGSIDQNTAHIWLKQLFEILDITHRSTFFHRDIKPANIIVKPNNQLALIDFGAVQEITDDYLAKASINGGTSTGIGIQYKNLRIGTPGYAPLEQMDGRATPQSDFYAVGRTFVRLLTGKHLFDLKTNSKTGKLIWRHKAPQIDKPFADFIDHLMTPFPGDRPHNAQIVLQRLDRLPLQSKFHRTIKSKYFKISVFVLTALTLFGGYKISRPIIADYFVQLANKASRENNFTEAEKKFNTALEFSSDTDQNWKTHYDFGVFYDNHLKYPQALRQYRLAIKDNKNAAEVLNNLSRLNNKDEKYDKAQSLALEGLQKTNDKRIQATLYKNLGWALFEQQKYVEAQISLEQAKTNNKQLTSAYCLLAKTEERLNNKADARLHWDVCITLLSTLPEVQEWRQEFLQRIP